MSPVRHEMVHDPNELGVVCRLQQMSHFVDDNVFKAFARFLGQLGMVHDPNELGVVCRLQQMSHFVDDNVFKAFARFLGQLGMRIDEPLAVAWGRGLANLGLTDIPPAEAWRPILSAYPGRFAIIVPEGGLSGSKAMEWFKRKTSIAGYEISNWIIILGAIIIVLLIFQNLH